MNKKESKLKLYNLYFHYELKTSGMLDSEDGFNGLRVIPEDEYKMILNPDLKFRVMSHGKDAINGIDTYMLECWIEYQALNDEKARNKATKVLDKNNFNFIDVYYILDLNQSYREVYGHNVREEESDRKS